MMQEQRIRLHPKQVVTRIPFRQDQRVIRAVDRMKVTALTPENSVAMDFGLMASWAHRASKTSRSSPLNKICPEQKLAVAIFSQAANDLQEFRYALGTGYLIYDDARKWIASNDRVWPCSFLNLCDALHLAPDVIRAELLSNTPRHSFVTS